jgi:hypothetical protein
LTIKRFSRHDEGVYSCRATRQIVNWDVQVEVRLVMRGKCKRGVGGDDQAPGHQLIIPKIASQRVRRPLFSAILLSIFCKFCCY